MVSVLPDDKMAAQSMRSASVPGKGIAQHAYAHPHVATAVQSILQRTCREHNPDRSLLCLQASEEGIHEKPIGVRPKIQLLLGSPANYELLRGIYLAHDNSVGCMCQRLW